jgi:hypothetical protein
MDWSAIQTIIMLLGAVGTLGATVWTVRGMLARFDLKLTRMEERLANGRERFERLEQRVGKHSEKLDSHGNRLLDLERPRTNSHPKLRPN